MVQKGEGGVKLKTRLPVISNRTATVGAITGIMIALVISLVLITALSYLTTSGKFPETSLGWSVFTVRAVAVLMGALVGTALSKDKSVITIGIIVVGYLALLLGFGIIIYDSSFQNFGSGVISAVLGGVIGCLIRIKSQNKPRRVRKIKV